MLTSGWILVNGTPQAGSESSPWTHRAIITLTGTAGDPSVMGMGNKLIGVNGRIELHGEKRGGWTWLRVTAARGATQLSLERNPGWRAGDRIVLASSDYNQNQAEEKVVAGVSGTTVTLTSPLAHEHYGEIIIVSGTAVDERAEVGLLSRNITIRGGISGTAACGTPSAAA